MLNNLKNMTWGMHAFHLFMFALGAIALIVFAIHHDNPKLGGDPLILLIPAGGLMGGAIYSFIRCLFDKPEGQYHPYMSQEEKDRMTTSNKK